MMMNSKDRKLTKPSPLTPDEQALSRLIASQAGYCVTALGDRLAIYQLDSDSPDGQYAVALDDHDGNELEERHFKSPDEAAVFFETHRKRMRMGFEFENAVMS
jgi:hypothetical protein